MPPGSLYLSGISITISKAGINMDLFILDNLFEGYLSLAYKPFGKDMKDFRIITRKKITQILEISLH